MKPKQPTLFDFVPPPAKVQAVAAALAYKRQEQRTADIPARAAQRAAHKKPKPTPEQRYVQWRDSNEHIYQEFKKFALEAIRSGRKLIGAKQVIERIRWDTMLAGSDDDFKVNNDYAPYLAREFMRHNPQHEGIFSLRVTKKDRTK